MDATKSVAGNAGFYRRGSWIRGVFERGWLALALLALLCVASCSTVAVTGRRQFNLFSPSEESELGAAAYTEMLAESKGKEITSGPDFDMVQRVTKRISVVSDDPGFQWEAKLIDDPEMVNAWCLPGGKIAVYTGILPVCQGETGLAVVLGHEIAHAIARHGTSRMSTTMATQVGIELAATQSEDVAKYREVVLGAANLLVLMPFGRDDELEADHIGLVYMARAGYDPREAKAFWERMSTAGGGQEPPEFLSTHPSHSSRVEQIERLLPKALAEYEAAKVAPKGPPKPISVRP